MTDLANYYDESYPPSILGLSSTHDLQLVATVTDVLEVTWTWDSSGKTATIDFGDGANETTDTETAVHTYAAADEYTGTVTSPNASDSAVVNLGGVVFYNPTEHTIDEIKAYVEGLGDPDDTDVMTEVQRLLDAERAGSARSTLIAWLDARLGVV